MKGITDILKNLNRKFIIIVLITAALSTLAFPFVNHSSLSIDLAFKNSEDNSARVVRKLNKLSIDYGSTILNIESSTEELSARQFLKNSNEKFLSHNDFVLGYFYFSPQGNSVFYSKEYDVIYNNLLALQVANKDAYPQDIRSLVIENRSHKSILTSIYYTENNKTYFSYIVPLWSSTDNVLGFSGVLFELFPSSNNTLFGGFVHNGNFIHLDSKLDTPELTNIISKIESGSGATKVFVDDSEYIITYHGILDNLSYVEIVEESHILFPLLAVLGITIVSFVIFMLFTHRSPITSYAVSDFFSDKLAERYNKNSTSSNILNYRAIVLCLLLISAISLMLSTYSSFKFTLYSINYSYLAIFIITFTSFLVFVFYGFIKNFTNFIILVLMTMPSFAILFFPQFHDVLDAPLSILTGLLISQFFYDKKLSHQYLYLFTCSLFVYLIIAIVFIPNLLSAILPDMLWTITNMLFLGFIICIIMNLFKKYEPTVSPAEEPVSNVKFDEEKYIRDIRISVLDQLIASVQHKINTPLATLKASCEDMELYTDDIFRAIVGSTKDFTETDIDDFTDLSKLCSTSIKEMRSPLEIKRSKPELLDFFEKLNPGQSSKNQEIVNMLTDLESCRIEKLEKNIDIFKNEKIIDILKLLLICFPFLNGIQNMLQCSAQISKIVFTIRAFSTGDFESQNKFSEFNIIENINDALALCINVLKPSIDLKLDIPGDLPYILGNSEDLMYVWSNIIHNACQAMKGVGVLNIRIIASNPNKLEIYFSDTGVGISNENLDKVFDLFFTTQPLGEGSGLGLDICRKIINKHGGLIDITSEDKKGTVVKVTLPVSGKDAL